MQHNSTLIRSTLNFINFNALAEIMNKNTHIVKILIKGNNINGNGINNNFNIITMGLIDKTLVHNSHKKINA